MEEASAEFAFHSILYAELAQLHNENNGDMHQRWRAFERYGNKREEERQVGDRVELGDTMTNYALKSDVYKFICRKKTLGV